jgi:xylulose-5-phosphate/fructose-6-phosphate phosphoketolase
MPGEVIDQPNPPPLTSHLPDTIEELAVKPSKAPLSNLDLVSLREFQRAACYIASGGFYLDL